MKKTTKNTLISVLGASLLAMSVPSAAYAEIDTDYAINVNIRIEGINECFYCGDIIYLSSSETALLSDILKFADEFSENFEITWTESDFGSYISAVNGDVSAHFGGWDGWMYLVNGVSPSVGVSAYEVSDGDEIVLYYSDQYGAGMQFPVMNYDVRNSVLTFTSEDSTYDLEGNEVVSINPVADMEVTLGGDVSYSFVTDENGSIDLSEADVVPGEYNVSYKKQSESGIPLVLRSAPDLTLQFGYPLGDVNCDGIIDAVDASYILMIYAKMQIDQDSGASEVEKYAANVNQDAVIDAVDASLAIGYYAYKAVGGEGSFEEYLSK